MPNGTNYNTDSRLAVKETPEGFGHRFIEAMAADCTVIAADHPESAAEEVISEAGFLVEPMVDALSNTPNAILGDSRPPISPIDYAQQYDWDRVTEQAENAYQRAIDGNW
ncbi:MAG: glycosyltransferase [Halopenitus sp.]